MLPRGRVYRYPPGRNVPDVSMGAAGMGPVPYDIGNGMQLRDAAISQPIPIGALASALANASPTEQRTVSFSQTFSFTCSQIFSLLFSFGWEVGIHFQS